MLFYECPQENTTYDSYFLNLSRLENLPGALVLRIHVHFKLNWLKHIISIQGLNILREEKLCGRNVGGVYFCFGTTNLTIFCFHLPRVN